MALEQPSQETLDRFDESVDDATHAVITEFEWMGLPEGDQLSDLMVRINDAVLWRKRKTPDLCKNVTDSNLSFGSLP